MPTNVLVTGGAGFLGRFIVDAILEKHQDWTITVFDLVGPGHARSNVRYEVGDVTVDSSVRSVIRKAEPCAIIHAAGIVPELAERYGRRLEAQVFRANVEGTRNMLAAAKDHGVEAFVWTGSCTAVTDDMNREYRNIDEAVPTSKQSLVYGESKVRATFSLSQCQD